MYGVASWVADTGAWGMFMTYWCGSRAGVLGANLIYFCLLSCGTGPLGNLGIKYFGKGVDNRFNRAYFLNADVGWFIPLVREFERPCR